MISLLGFGLGEQKQAPEKNLSPHNLLLSPLLASNTEIASFPNALSTTRKKVLAGYEKISAEEQGQAVPARKIPRQSMQLPGHSDIYTRSADPYWILHPVAGLGDFMEKLRSGALQKLRLFICQPSHRYDDMALLAQSPTHLQLFEMPAAYYAGEFDAFEVCRNTVRIWKELGLDIGRIEITVLDRSIPEVAGFHLPDMHLIEAWTAAGIEPRQIRLVGLKDGLWAQGGIGMPNFDPERGDGVLLGESTEAYYNINGRMVEISNTLFPSRVFFTKTDEYFPAYNFLLPSFPAKRLEYQGTDLAPALAQAGIIGPRAEVPGHAVWLVKTEEELERALEGTALSAEQRRYVMDVFVQPFMSESVTGLDRITMILQQADSVFDTDALAPVCEAVYRSIPPQIVRNLTPETAQALVRIVVDGLKAAVFLIGDGADPIRTHEADRGQRDNLFWIASRHTATALHLLGIDAEDGGNDPLDAILRQFRRGYEAEYPELLTDEALAKVRRKMRERQDRETLSLQKLFASERAAREIVAGLVGDGCRPMDAQEIHALFQQAHTACPYISAKIVFEELRRTLWESPSPEGFRQYIREQIAGRKSARYSEEEIGGFLDALNGGLENPNLLRLWHRCKDPEFAETFSARSGMPLNLVKQLKNHYIAFTVKTAMQPLTRRHIPVNELLIQKILDATVSTRAALPTGQNLSREELIREYFLTAPASPEEKILPLTDPDEIAAALTPAGKVQLKKAPVAEPQRHNGNSFALKPFRPFAGQVAVGHEEVVREAAELFAGLNDGGGWDIREDVAVVGLRNDMRDQPAEENGYDATPHNLGAMFADCLLAAANRGRETPIEFEREENCEVARIPVGGHFIYLIKPVCDINFSGGVLARMLNALGLPKTIVVADDVQTPFGTVNLSTHNTQHNGIASIQEHLGNVTAVSIGCDPETPGAMTRKVIQKYPAFYRPKIAQAMSATLNAVLRAIEARERDLGRAA